MASRLVTFTKDATACLPWRLLDAPPGSAETILREFPHSLLNWPSTALS